jgi:hypothetical protein
MAHDPPIASTPHELGKMQGLETKPFGRIFAMNSITNIFAAAAVSIILSFAAQAEEVHTMKPLQGVSFHAGTTQASGYFLKNNSACQLVVTAADEGHFAPSRFEAAIETGRSTRYQLAEGKTLEFACRADGQELAVTSLETTAAN